MNLYVAPLEGITGYIFRNVFNQYFGIGVDKYYTPFLALCNKKGITDRERKDVIPENNQGYNLVPQVMTIVPEDFIKAKNTLRELGYHEININFGCPARTVTSRGRGAGALADLVKLDNFLEQIFKDGDKDISIKTRIGIENADEFTKIMEIYNQYPIKELTIHPRTLKELYKGVPHRDTFLAALNTAKMPVCYNGDINTVNDYIELDNLIKDHSNAEISGIMIGRGILRDPALIRKISAFIKNGDISPVEENKATNEEIFNYLCTLQSNYSSKFSGEIPVLYKMKELWAYLGLGLYEGQNKLFKKIMKCNSIKDYERYVNQILQ